MPKKGKKQSRQTYRNKKPITSDASQKQKRMSAIPKWETNLTIWGNVKNAIIIVRSGGSRGLIAERIQQYREQPSLLWSDFPLLCLFSSFSLSILYIVFILLYYGTDTKVFSNTGSLLLFPQLKYLVNLLLFVGCLYLLVLFLFRLIRKRDLLSVVSYSTLLAPTFAFLSFFILILSGLLQHQLIVLNYKNAIARADELVGMGQFELATQILLLYPEDERHPIYVSNQQADTGEQSNNIVGQDSEDQNRALDAFEKIASRMYGKGDYQEIIRTVCAISYSGLGPKLLPYWRSAAYVIAHDPAWGPDKTLTWIGEVNDKYPSCRQLSSPFWLVIPPEIAWLIDERDWHYGMGKMGDLYSRWSYMPIEQALGEAYTDLKIRDLCKSEPDEDASNVSLGVYREHLRCEYDLRLVEKYLEDYPEDPYADYGKFVLGNLDQIIREGLEKNNNLYDFAAYEKGWRLYQKGDYESALRGFQAFLYIKNFKDHPWRDDALWRTAMCYMHLGQYIDAIKYLSLMERAPDGEVPGYADMWTNVLYIADVLLSTQELERVVTENLFPNLMPVLKYTLAERWLADGFYEKSRNLFAEIREQNKSQVFEAGGRQISFAEMSEQKLHVIDILMGYQKEHPGDASLYIADYLDTYDAFSPLENELRYPMHMFGGDERQITAGYLINRSKNYVAAELRSKYLIEHPDYYDAAGLLFKIAQDYEAVASWADLPVSQGFLPMVQKKASSAYMDYLEEGSVLDREKFDQAMEHAGSLYMARCVDYVLYLHYCDLENIRGMRAAYRQLVDKYPHHRLANNMLNWIAWSYCYEANTPDLPDSQYVDLYKKALSAYREIAESYPDGIIGQNARDNIPLIEAKIQDPSARIPPNTWSWTESQ